MSRLKEELLSLRAWDESQMEGRSGLCLAVEKLSISMAASCGMSSPALLFLTGSRTASTVRTSTWEVGFSSIDELYVSCRRQLDGPDIILGREVPRRARPDLPRKLDHPP